MFVSSICSDRGELRNVWCLMGLIEFCLLYCYDICW